MQKFLFKTEICLNEDFKNVGYDRNGFRSLRWLDDQSSDILYTYLDAKPVTENIYVSELGDYIKAYSIFTRTKKSNHKNDNDSNPVLYALKNEKRWRFESDFNKKQFWNRFSLLLQNFLFDHKNEFDTTIVIPSSNRLNKEIIDEIEKYAVEVGIKNIIRGGLRTIPTDVVRERVLQHNSFFQRYWKDLWIEKMDELDEYLYEMDDKKNGLFEYHMITDINLRKSIIHTLEVDKSRIHQYKEHINNKNILLVDDSITLGQSIRNAIFAITQAYVPKSISILTMFSKLYYDIDDKYCPYNGTYYEN